MSQLALICIALAICDFLPCRGTVLISQQTLDPHTWDSSSRITDTRRALSMLARSSRLPFLHMDCHNRCGDCGCIITGLASWWQLTTLRILTGVADDSTVPLFKDTKSSGLLLSSFYIVPSKSIQCHHASNATFLLPKMHQTPHPPSNPPYNLTPPTDNFFQSSSSNLTYLSPSGLIQ